MYKENISEAEYDWALVSLQNFCFDRSNLSNKADLSDKITPVGRALRTVTLARGEIHNWGGAYCPYLDQEYLGNLFIFEQESGGDQQDWIAICSGDNSVLVRKWVKRNLLKARADGLIKKGEDKYSLPIIEGEYRFQLPSSISIASTIDKGFIGIFAQDQEEPYPVSDFITQTLGEVPSNNKIFISHDNPVMIRFFAQIVKRGVCDLLPRL